MLQSPVAPLSEMAIAAVILRIKARAGTAESFFQNSPSLRLPLELQKRVQEVLDRPLDRFGHWVVWVNVMALASWIGTRYLVSGAALCLRNRRVLMADFLVQRERRERCSRKKDLKKGRSGKRLLNGLRDISYPQDVLRSGEKYRRLIRGAGWIRDMARFTYYLPLVLFLRSKNTPSHDFLIGVARRGDLEAYKKFSSLIISAESEDGNPPWPDLAIAATRSGDWDLFEFLLKEYPQWVRMWGTIGIKRKILCVAMATGNVRVVQWYLTQVPGSPLMSSWHLQKAVSRRHYQVLELIMKDWKPLTLWTLSYAILLDGETFAERLWTDHHNEWHELQDVLLLAIAQTLKGWSSNPQLSRWMARFLSLYHRLPIPTFRDSHEEDHWIAPLLHPLLHPPRNHHNPLDYQNRTSDLHIIAAKGPSFLDRVYGSKFLTISTPDATTDIQSTSSN